MKVVIVVVVVVVVVIRLVAEGLIVAVDGVGWWWC